MNLRLQTLQNIGKKHSSTGKSPFFQSSPPDKIKVSSHFGSRVFGRALIESLPKKVAQNWLDTIDGKASFDASHADAIAEALQTWALKFGATYFTHWFQPLTNSSAEKHDSFLSWKSGWGVIEKFRGKELLRGEPDASSFPSGGLRCTHEARGYTVWDPTSFPFLWESAEGLTLCLPSVFLSWKGEALDYKIPLLRSEEKLNTAVLRLLNLCSVPADSAYSTLGIEQEYFVIDRSLFLLRPDLLFAGRTVFGAKSPKGQELEDHYFGPIKNRVMAYIRDFEDAALRLGIPVKTRHSEVAPGQYEVAPLFEKASLAADHNLQLMELMRQLAAKHDLACLLHEKPFMGINGSGKHNNWSIATDKGLNLLDPQANSLVFLTMLTAVLRAVHEHAALLRASIGSAGNDHRLGGSEAPPTILSVYLGDALERIVHGVLYGKKEEITLRTIDLGLRAIPRHEADASDRNRTSFFAFTGNKFEFRAVGASAHCAKPASVINAIVADSLQGLLDEIGALTKGRQLSSSDLFTAALSVLRKSLKVAEPVLFGGNNYSAEWEKAAATRGLPNIRKSFLSFGEWISKKTVRAFEGILSEAELHSRYEVFVEQYAKAMNIEVNLMIELFQTEVLPAAQKDFHQRGASAQFAPLLDKAQTAAEELKKIQAQMANLDWEARAKIFCEAGALQMESLRKVVDEIETVVDNALWPLPKYRELLFLV